VPKDNGWVSGKALFLHGCEYGNLKQFRKLPQLVPGMGIEDAVSGRMTGFLAAIRQQHRLMSAGSPADFQPSPDCIEKTFHRIVLKLHLWESQASPAGSAGSERDEGASHEGWYLVGKVGHV